MNSDKVRLLKPTEVTQLTGLSRATVYRMVAAGTLPALRAGSSIRVPLSALEQWIEANTAGGIPPGLRAERARRR